MPRKINLPKKIKVKGGASEKTFEFEVKEEDGEMDLLCFLRSRSLPVASSCSGVGQCHKCLFNRDQLACQSRVKDFWGKEITIDYL